MLRPASWLAQPHGGRALQQFSLAAAAWLGGGAAQPVPAARHQLPPPAAQQRRRQQQHTRSQASPDEEGLKEVLYRALRAFKGGSGSGAASGVGPEEAAKAVVRAYDHLGGQRRQLEFFSLLTREFGVEAAAIDAAAQLWRDRAGAAAPPELLRRLADRLAAAARPQYAQLLLPVGQHAGGIAFLVRLRGDLLELLHEQPALPQGAALRALAEDLREALARWFALGLLQLRRITWEQAPGQLLEAIVAAEAVHRMDRLEQLKRRLQQSDRRVYAFLHPSLPSSPLAVLHTAIVDHVPCSMAALLGQRQERGEGEGGGGGGGGSEPGGAGCGEGGGSVACFYSISAGVPGLRGLDLGVHLIKQAAQLLLAELPQLRTLATLSPVPGFRAWLVPRLQQEAAGATAGDPLLLPEEAPMVAAAHSWLARQVLLPCSGGGGGGNGAAAAAAGGQPSAAAALLSLVERNAWTQLPEQHQAALQPVFVRLCAHYLLRERRRGAVLDAVAHFHLRNGASLWRINPRADLSAAGLERSCGLMANYHYALEQVPANSRAYSLEQTMAASASVRALLEPPRPAAP